MALYTTLAALSQTAASNPPDGSVDAPSTVDDQLRLLGAFIAQLRDNNGFTAAPLPAGVMLDHGGSTAPTGFLLCDGSAVSRTTYSALYTAIGTTWGVGDGSTTFNVPDLRRRTTIGSGGTAVAGPANTLGSVGGEETHALTTAELAAHSHTVNITDPGHGHGVTDPGHAHGGTYVRTDLGGGNFSGGATTFGLSTTNSATTGISVNSASSGITAASTNTGSGTAHNNMQPSAVVTKIIKT